MRLSRLWPSMPVLEADSEDHESHSTSRCHCRYPVEWFVGGWPEMGTKKTQGLVHHNGHNAANQLLSKTTPRTTAMR